MTMNIKYYLKRVDIDGQNKLSIEDDFPHIRYISMVGMNDVGDSKVVYTESYAESDRLRHYVPSDDNDYTHTATEIVMSVAIFGTPSERQNAFDSFVDYITKGVHSYWDTERKRTFDFVVQKGVKISDEKWHNRTPYILVEIPLQNLNGKTFYTETF